ncbi:SNF2 family N-terminal domain-containing protein [Amanita rubescens]|nr:SNF2 family N-terminal domain-containing protein [Amanita rubescens]
MAVTEEFDGNATVDEAIAKLGLKSQYEMIPGMVVPLMPHQSIGVAWMLEKEASKLKGGALSDEMGLGKTVQMIALMVKNRSSDPLCKTNLVIAPAALLDQWKLEIELKTNNMLSCLIYMGSLLPKRKEDLMKHDVVLTTFQTMSSEWYDVEKEMKRQEKQQRRRKCPAGITESEPEDCTHSSKKRRISNGLLFDVEFYRVVLDEAQNIRNRRTRMSRSVLELQTTYRWCLTGTPIINTLSDVYPYLRFIRVSPWHDFKEFQQHIGRIEKKRPTLAVQRLQAIITTFLLRRMKDSKLDGKRLIELPEKNVGMVQLEFSPEERDVYRMVEIRSQAKFNKYLRAGTVLKNYHQVLVLLLRLRQICCHPCLVTEDGNPFVKPGEFDNDKARHNGDELSRARYLVSQAFVERMLTKLKEASMNRVAEEKESADAYFDDECPICFDIRRDAVITPCTHIFCHECILDVLNTPPVENMDEPMKFKEDERPCPSCRSPISKEKLFTRAAFEAVINDDIPESSKPEGAGGGVRQRNEGDLDDPELDLETKVNKAIGLVPRFLPSTKMKYMMEAIIKILQEKPDEKILVISQWTSCLALVSEYLREHHVPHEKYQGDMKRAERDKAVREFMTEMKSQVLLLSLKCGGVGLNLTRANNVILLDLAWSQAIESQAFDRVHRLGQTRAVHVQKLVISNTVEDRILQLQLRKQQLADGSLGEGSGKKIGREY